MKKLSCALLALVFVSASLTAQKLDKFGADLGKKSVMGKEIRVPYTDIQSYFGYIKPGSKPDEVVGGKKMYYVYVWVPVAAPEIGIRMISPAPDSVKPSDKDYVTADYTANATENKKFFDTWVQLERAEGIMKIEDVAAKAKTAKWTKID